MRFSLWLNVLFVQTPGTLSIKSFNTFKKKQSSLSALVEPGVAREGRSMRSRSPLADAGATASASARTAGIDAGSWRVGSAPHQRPARHRNGSTGSLSTE